ncbi:MAG: hypothetical protein DRP78_04045 [Candidatus Omnitrophota bacterium]|nr:MAG: hypothetical protein DRP78_04045 [Candidatus Omnitrophota bacterium]
MFQEKLAQTKKNIFCKHSTFFLVIVFCLFGVVIGILFEKNYLSNSSKIKNGWPIAKMRDYAAKLQMNGLCEQAMTAFEEYLGKSNADSPLRANVYYSLGEMFIKAKQYENALAYFYKAEIANPNIEVKSEIGLYIVNCLENMGKNFDAQYQLQSRALLKGETQTEKSSGEVVAKIGSRKIYLSDLNAEIEKFPEWMQKDYKDNQVKKLEFLNQYIFQLLLYDKGIKLGMDKEPVIREQVKDFQTQIIVQKVMQKEIMQKIKLDHDDIKNYYTAHQDEYQRQAKLKFKYILVDTKEQADVIIDQLEKGTDFAELAKLKSNDQSTADSGGIVSEWVEQTGDIPGIGKDNILVDALFNLPEDSKAQIVESERGFAVVQIMEKKQAVTKPFEQVKSEVERKYQQQKIQALTMELMSKLLQTKDVVIYEHKFEK